MRRVKLIVSDFHLGTGHINPDGSLNLMEDFVLDEKFVEFIEYYSTGNFTNAEVELIINGDFFNMIQTEVDQKVPSNITETLATKQMEKIIAGHPVVMDALKLFAELPDKTLTFIVGNHDFGLIFSEVKRVLKDQLGKQVRILNRSYEFDKVLVEHGDRYEPVHEVDARMPLLSKGLKDPILNIPWATYFFINFVRKQKSKRHFMDKVKPFRNYLTWSAVYDFTFFLTTITKLIFFVLYSMLFSKVGNKRFGLSVIPMLIRQNIAYPEMKKARKILKLGRVHTVIFGHTHHALQRQFYRGQYFNTGCWNGVTQLDIEAYGYQTRLTYAYLKWNEDHNRWLTSLRAWKGRSLPFEKFHG